MDDSALSRSADDPPLALYANYCDIGHNAFEFLFDFGQFLPERSSVQIITRIVSGPVQAKLFARLLSEAVGRYEATHGAIADLAEDDALEALISGLPEFERRAVRIRSQPRAPATPAPHQEK